MPYIGKQPANVPVTADDIPDNSITAAKIVDGAITIADIADDAVTADKLANSINTDIATGVTGNTTANAALPKAGGAMTGAITTNSTFDGVDIATRDGVLTSTTATAAAALPKAGGTMTGTLSLGDNVKAKFGTGNDLEIYHNGSHSYIDDVGTGDLNIGASSAVKLRAPTGGELYATFNDNGAVNLYYDAAVKLATTSTGIDVTGTVTCDGLNSSAAMAFTAADGMVLSAQESLIIDIDLDDNNSSRVFNVRSGAGGSVENLINASEDSGVTLYFDNAAKIATTSAGVTVTGAVTATSFTGSGAALTGITTGKVLQVLETIWNTDVTFPQNQNFTSVGTGLTITPTASSSKILVLYTYAITADAGNYSCVHGKLVRDSTNIAENWYMGYVGNEQFHRLQSWSFTYLDSPNTTSSIVYSLTGANGTGSSFSGTYGGGFNVSGLTTRMTLIEIGA